MDIIALNADIDHIVTNEEMLRREMNVIITEIRGSGGYDSN
jgi:hypothetical protein